MTGLARCQARPGRGAGLNGGSGLLHSAEPESFTAVALNA